MKRKFFVLLLSMFAALLTAQTSLTLTVDELAVYNGKDGKSAYIAYEGTIYDVTGVKAWENGIHKENQAGSDLSSVLKNAPHQTAVLDNLKKVGRLVKGFKAEEISKYTGKGGNPAYIVVDGLVYDVTDSPKWKSGKHGGVKTGEDGSIKIKKSPHKHRVLQNIPLVGKIVK